VAFRILLIIMYAVGIGFVAIVGISALPYYLQAVADRPHSELHAAMKPGGLWGHGMGIVGSTMMVLMLFYSARKRRLPGFRWGSLSRWLDIHIYFGVMGPLLVTLHTAMKFHGLVSISYFSMLVVAFSGVFGRYIYMQIPRDPRGHARSLEDVQKRVGEINKIVVEEYRAPQHIVDILSAFTAPPAKGSGIGAVFRSVFGDVTTRIRGRRLRREIKRHGGIPHGEVGRLVALAREQLVLQRKITFLDSMTATLHYWHVFHRPFAYVMLTIMVIHVGVAVAFGYRWIW